MKNLNAKHLEAESKLFAAQRLNTKLRDRLDRVMADWYSGKTISEASESMAHSLLSETFQEFKGAELRREMEAFLARQEGE